MTRVLITGANGQLGMSIRDLQEEHPNIDFLFKMREQLDITNANQLNEFFGSMHFDYCINCAAYTNVEQAEKTPEIAFKVNEEGVRNLANACKENKVILIHISTDYVFDGEKGEPYTVEDIPNPINEYGMSKWEGERHVQEILSNFYIVRTSWLYHKDYGKNFYKTILEKAKRGEPINVTDEQVGCPTNAVNLGKFILSLINTDKHPYGIFHYTDGVAMTWYDFSKKIAEENKLKGVARVVKDNNYRSFARRPKFSVLI